MLAKNRMSKDVITVFILKHAKLAATKYHNSKKKLREKAMMLYFVDKRQSKREIYE
ncbi:MAG: hypothetical protein K9N10_05345 [Deltaproteobacteria bacterium]|nr:hypothetical protein [Deltaproteobacteria bacterium]